jgi:hypothetical protein
LRNFAIAVCLFLLLFSFLLYNSRDLSKLIGFALFQLSRIRLIPKELHRLFRLLRHFPKYYSGLPLGELQGFYCQEILLGMSDRDDVIVSSTLHALGCVVSACGADTLGFMTSTRRPIFQDSSNVSFERFASLSFRQSSTGHVRLFLVALMWPNFSFHFVEGPSVFWRPILFGNNSRRRAVFFPKHHRQCLSARVSRSRSFR